MAVTSASVSVNAEANLGSTLEVQFSARGPQTWVYVLNEGSTDLAAGEVVIRNTTSTEYKVIVAPASSISLGLRVIGIAQHAIPAGSYGYVLRRGIGTVKIGSGAGVSDVDSLTSGGAEAGTLLVKANSAAGAAGMIALAVQNIAASGTGLAFIDCRG
jgi:hypothetical protein